MIRFKSIVRYLATPVALAVHIALIAVSIMAINAGITAAFQETVESDPALSKPVDEPFVDPPPCDEYLDQASLALASFEIEFPTDELPCIDEQADDQPSVHQRPLPGEDYDCGRATADLSVSFEAIEPQTQLPCAGQDSNWTRQEQVEPGDVDDCDEYSTLRQVNIEVFEPFGGDCSTPNNSL